MTRCAIACGMGVLLLGGWTSAYAAGVTTPVKGTFNNTQENACIHISFSFYLADCSYEASHGQEAGNTLTWVGPTVNPVYYVPGSPHAVPSYRPVPGDDRIAPSLSGTLTIDRHATGNGMEDLISGVLTVGPAARTVVTNVNSQSGKPPRSVESWTSIVHTLAPTAVNSAVRNASGGYDYVIGEKGFPNLICRTEDPTDCFTSAYAPKTTDGPKRTGVWSSAGKVGVGRDPYLGGNPGATTTAVINGYSCADNQEGVECATGDVVWGSVQVGHSQRCEQLHKNDGRTTPPCPSVGLSNLLLKVSTNAAGKVIAAEGFWTHEYRIEGGAATFQPPGNNSWQGGYLRLTGVAPTGRP